MAKDSTQEQFAQLIGISQPAVAQLIRKGVLSRKGNIVQWTKEYTENLRRGLGMVALVAEDPKAREDQPSLDIRQRRHP